jgi:hypothetical protein
LRHAGAARPCRRRKSFWVQSLTQEQFLWDLELPLAMTRSEAPATA